MARVVEKEDPIVAEGGDRPMMAKISRNQRCPCGSRLRHKHCHGSFAPDPFPQDFFPSDVDTLCERYSGVR